MSKYVSNVIKSKAFRIIWFIFVQFKEKTLFIVGYMDKIMFLTFIFILVSIRSMYNVLYNKKNN